MNIVSYNCHGLPKSFKSLHQKPSLISLFDKCDILCLQETWYSTQDLANLNNIHSNFHGIGTATINYKDALHHGHPPGGVAILWKSGLDSYVSPLKFEHDWITGIEIKYDNKKHVLLCVYMPCLNGSDDHDNLYLQCLGILLSIIEDVNCICINVVGDFYANINNNSHSAAIICRTV